MSVSSQATLCISRGAEVAQAYYVSDGVAAMVRESVSRRTLKSAARELQNMPVPIRFATRLPRICSPMDMIFASCKSCWDTRMCEPQ